MVRNINLLKQNRVMKLLTTNNALRKKINEELKQSNFHIKKI